MLCLRFVSDSEVNVQPPFSDHALTYIMEFYPPFLPSFDELPDLEKLDLLPHPGNDIFREAASRKHLN